MTMSLALLDSDDAVRMVAAWPLVTRTEREEPSTDGPWGRIHYDAQEWADLARVPLAIAETIACSLIGAGLILPDGRARADAAELVQRYIQRKKVEIAIGRVPTVKEMRPTPEGKSMRTIANRDED